MANSFKINPDDIAEYLDEEPAQANTASFKINPDDIAEYLDEEPAAPTTDPDKTWGGDVVTAFGRGAAGMVRAGGMALRKVGMESAGAALDQVGRENEEYYGKFSGQTVAAQQKPWIKDDGSFNSDLTLDDMARKVAISSVESLPGQVPMALVGGVLTKAALKGAPLLAKGMAPIIGSAPVQRVLSNGMVRKGLDSSVGRFVLGETAVGTAPKMAIEAAEFAARGLGFGAAEGAYSGLSNAVEVGDRVRKEVSLDSFLPPEHQGYGFDANVPAPPAEVVAAAEAAREQVARQAENEVIWKTALVDMAVSIPTGGGAFGEAMRLPEGLFGRGIKRGLVGTALRGAVRGGGKEAVQEFFQSGGENRVSDVAMERAAVPGVQPSLIGDLNAAIDGAAAGGLTGGMIGGAGQVSQRNSLNVLANADPDLKQETERLMLAKTIGASLETTQERAQWAANSITAISLGLPIDLESDHFLKKPETSPDSAPLLSPDHEAFDALQEMPEPRGPLARAAAQGAPAVPVIDPLAPGQDLPSMAAVAPVTNGLVGNVLYDNETGGLNNGSLPGVQQEVSGAAQVVPPMRGENVAAVDADPLGLPALHSRMAELTGDAQSPENAALVDEFLATNKNLANFAPAFKERRLAEFVETKQAERAIPPLSTPELPLGTSVGGAEDIAVLHADIINKTIDGSVKRAVRFDVVDRESAQRLKEATGLDLEGYGHTVDTFGIRHALNPQGQAAKEETRGQVALTADDFLLIPEIVKNYDAVESTGKDATGNDLIQYRKAFDGAMYYVEEVRKKQGELMIKTLWKTRTASHAPSVEVPHVTPEAIQPESSQDLDTQSLPPAATAVNAGSLSPPLPLPKAVDNKPLSRAETRSKERSTVNPASDDLLMAIRKLGGLDKAQALEQWGKSAIESDYLSRSPLPGKPVLRNKAGLPLDRMLTTLKGHGYLAEDATLRDFEDLFLRAAGGETVLTDQGDERAADALYKAEMARMMGEMKSISAQELAQEIDPDFASLIAGAPELEGITPEALEWTTDVFNDILDGGFLMTADDYLRSILEESDDEGNYTGRSQGAVAQAAAGTESQGNRAAATGVDAETATAGTGAEVTAVVKPAKAEDSGEETESITSDTADSQGIALFAKAKESFINGLDVADVRQLTAGIIRTFPGSPHVEVINDYAALPAEIQREAARQEAGENFPGVLHKGTAFILAGNLESDAHLEEVLLHEIMGHYSIKQLFGQRENEKLNALFVAMGGYPGLLRLAKVNNWTTVEEYARGFVKGNYDQETRRALLVHELLAHQAQIKQPKIIQAIKEYIGALKEWLRSKNFKYLPELSTNDLAYLLKQARAVMTSPADMSGTHFMTAWHGSPHTFEKFSSGAMGTGEGNQAYGYGLYMASSREVAEHYRKGLSQNEFIAAAREAYDQFSDPEEAVDSLLGSDSLNENQRELILALQEDDWLGFDYPHQAISAAFKSPENFEMSERTKSAIAKQGALYNVELAPAEDEYLLWDRSLSEQSAKVKNLLAKAIIKNKKPEGTTAKQILAAIESKKFGKTTGSDFYRELSDEEGSDEFASSWLSMEGIRGIKYLDGTSRGKGDGSHNYVIFDENDISITAKYATTRQTILTGDSGLGKVTITPAKSLPFIGKALAKEGATQVSVKGGNVETLRKVAQGFGKNIVFFRQPVPADSLGTGSEQSGDSAEVRNDQPGGNNAPERGDGRGDQGLSQKDARESGRSEKPAPVISGFVNPAAPNILFLNVEAPDHLLFILGHEVSHTIKMQDPALWTKMAKELQPLIKNWSRYVEKMAQQYDALSEEDKAEELFADVMGDHFLNEKFWTEMAQASPSVFTRIAKTAIALLNKALRLMMGNDVGVYISDMTQARAIIAKALLQYGENVNRGIYGKFAEQADLEYLDNRLMGASVLEHLRAVGISEEKINAVLGLAPAKLAAATKGKSLTPKELVALLKGLGLDPLAVELPADFTVSESFDLLPDDLQRNIIVDAANAYTLRKADPKAAKEHADARERHADDVGRIAREQSARAIPVSGGQRESGSDGARTPVDAPLRSDLRNGEVGAVFKEVVTFNFTATPASFQDFLDLYKKTPAGIAEINALIQAAKKLGYPVTSVESLRHALQSEIILESPDGAETKYQIGKAIKQLDPRNVLEKVRDFMNPLDWSRLRATAEKRTSLANQHRISYMLMDPFFKQAKTDPAAKPFYQEGQRREVERSDYNILLRGGLVEGGERKTVWQETKEKQYNTLSAWEMKALDVLVVEGEARHVEYTSLTKALQNPAIKAAGVNEAVFTFYRSLLKAKELAANAQLDAERVIMEEAGMAPEKVKESIAARREAGKARVEFSYQETGGRLVASTTQGGVNVVHQLKRIAQELEADFSQGEDGTLTMTFKKGQIEAGKEALWHVTANRIPGHIYRDHGEGEHVVFVHQVIRSLDFDISTINMKDGKEGSMFFLPYYPGKVLTAKIEEVADELGASFLLQEGSGRVILTIRKDVAKLLQKKLAEIPLTGKSGKPYKVMVYRRHVDHETAAETLKKKVTGDFKKALPFNYRPGLEYEASWGISTSLQEEEYQALTSSSFAQDHMIVEALTRAKNRGELSETEYAKSLDAARENIAEQLLARGAGATMIRRVPYVIEGYDRENMVGNFERQIDGTAGMLSKSTYAMRQLKHMKTVPAETRRWAMSYIEGTLRNMTRFDQLNGDARGIIAFYYMGFSVSWALINHSQPYIVGISRLSRRINNGDLFLPKGVKGAAMQVLTAEKDLVVGWAKDVTARLAKRLLPEKMVDFVARWIPSNLSAEERALFQDSRVRVQLEETVLGEMSGSDATLGGKISDTIHSVTKFSLAHGNVIEVLNRKTMILAAYRTLKAQGMSNEKAMEEALEVNAETNIEQGRHNLPLVSSHHALARTSLALTSYIRHMLQTLFFDMSSGSRADQKAVLRMLFAMTLLGGVPAGWIGSDDLDKLFLEIWGYSPKQALKSYLRKAGKNYETVADLITGLFWRGAPDVAGVSMTGAVAFRVPYLSAINSGTDVGLAAIGPIGGIGNNILKASRAASQGDFYRATEHVLPLAPSRFMGAYRLATEGVTTSRGRKVYYQGQPLKLEPTEAILKAVGIQPARFAEVNEFRGYEMDLERIWKERRSDALDHYRETGKMNKVWAYNDKVQGNDMALALAGDIDGEALERALLDNPGQKKAQFEQAFGPDR